jgi:hypothetical protein
MQILKSFIHMCMTTGKKELLEMNVIALIVMHMTLKMNITFHHVVILVLDKKYQTLLLG